MSVTKSKKRKEDPLDLYVDFLNVDLSTDPRQRLRKGSRLKTFLDQFERESENPSNWLSEAKDLQGEIRNDIFPIAAQKEIPEKLFPVLERWLHLTEKLNEMEFRRRWDQHWDRKGRMTIIAWNLSNNQRENWYAGLADRLEDGDLERLRLCPICSKYFSARDKRQRFYPKSCKIKYFNKDAKFRVQRWRAKQTKDNEEKEKTRQYKQRINSFRDFLEFALANTQNTKEVGQMILRLGQCAYGDGIKGWKIIKECDDKLKNGISSQQIFEDLPQAIKDLFSDN